MDKKYEKVNYDITLKEGDPDCFGVSKHFSNALFDTIIDELGLTSFITRNKQLSNFEYDIMGFFRCLVFGRILNPSSKINTVNQYNDYYTPLLKDFYKYNVYDTLSFLYDNKSKIINKLNKSLITKFNRSTNFIYYDVTNFFFEIEKSDEDTELETGLRKFGVSKENRKQPIVQMGLFMDEQGIPISIESFPGNTLDHLTMKKALENQIENLKLNKFIFVGDRGMYRGNNTYHLIDSNNGYIISKSIEKTNREEKDWILNQDDYIIKSDDFKYKERIIKRSVKTEYGNKDIVEKVVVYFSKKFYDRQMYENKKFLEVIEKIEKNPANFRLTKSQSSSIRKFLRKELINDSTGEVVYSSDLKALLDYDKINKFKSSFGYYQIVTSELDMDPLKVIDTYHNLSKIEDQFRVMKSTLETRPIHVRTKEHIEAHLLICMISLVIIRLIQNKILEYKKKNNLINNDKLWEMGLSADRLTKALNKWKVSELCGYYRFIDINDEDLKLILDSYGIEIPCKLYKKRELMDLKSSINLFK